jgi:hypothetical protein
LDAALLSRDDIDVSPSNLDININKLGRNIRKIFRAIPGRKPWMNDLIAGLSNNSWIKNISNQGNWLPQRKREHTDLVLKAKFLTRNLFGPFKLATS